MSAMDDFPQLQPANAAIDDNDDLSTTPKAAGTFVAAMSRRVHLAQDELTPRARDFQVSDENAKPAMKRAGLELHTQYAIRTEEEVLPTSDELSPLLSHLNFINDEGRAGFERSFQSADPTTNPRAPRFRLSEPPSRELKALRKRIQELENVNRWRPNAHQHSKSKEYTRNLIEWSRCQIENVVLEEPVLTFKSPPSTLGEQSPSSDESDRGFFQFEPYVETRAFMPDEERVANGRLDSDRRYNPSLDRLGLPPLTADDLAVPKRPMPLPSPDTMTAMWNRRWTRVYSHPNNRHPLSYQLEPPSPEELKEGEMFCPLYLEQPHDLKQHQKSLENKSWGQPKQTKDGITYRDWIQAHQLSASSIAKPLAKDAISPKAGNSGEDKAMNEEAGKDQ